MYLDDFIQVSTAEQYQRVVEILTEFGFIMGRKKCEPPDVEREVLGLIICTASMTLTAPQEKIDLATTLLKAYAEKQRATAEELARVLGVLAAIEPAAPRVLLLARPMYDDLKDALVAAKQMHENDELHVERHGLADETLSGRHWKNAPVTPNGSGTEASEYIARRIADT